LEQHLSHFFGGGTEVYGPICAGLNEITEGDQKADVLVITDGDFAEPTDDFMAILKAAKIKRPLKVVTVVIGGSRGEHQAAKFSDKVVNVGNFVGDRESLREAIAGVV
jgi:uncharacterized protein with von Willebrand factor type A (vWA) domain